ncbi:MAG: glutamate---cysteine ligase / carboxylate-amine ligase [Solirubrobacteraceae bacterium]|jgi:carboxylate-amine ligase|nr:glutamate---cysteine ligase / carboxylate-amine ligase [Solirubrobacteraceae bacterium]
MDHAFCEPRFTVGVEEELMIVDAETHDLVNAVEQLLEDAPVGMIKPELMESVLEIATAPCDSVGEAADQLRTLRRHTNAAAATRGLAIASAGTHPLGLWEKQRIVGRPRYRALIDELAFVARQELVFGMHVHVGLDDPETAIAVANGLREYVPILLGLSANSPFWRGEETGLQSTRAPIFKAFPRVGIPPFYTDWDDYVARVRRMVDAGMIGDYTYLWWDVRPHPRLGTVEIRAMDSQTRLEHTIALTALVQTLVRSLALAHADGATPIDHPQEVLEANKWLAARYGTDARILDVQTNAVTRIEDLTRKLLDRLGEHADDLGCTAELAGIHDLLDVGNGAHRQLIVYRANHDLREMLAEIVAASAP